MFKWLDVFLKRHVAVLVLLMAANAGMILSAATLDDGMPERAEGTFIQRKTLADVEVTITSKGVFRFEKGKFFEWKTREPLPSSFFATPTNYAMTVNGKTTVHALKTDVSSVANLFQIKEVKDFVKAVKTIPERGFPEKVTVEFKNGDKLDIEMTR